MSDENNYTNLLLQSLINTPLLVDALDNIQSFDRSNFIKNPQNSVLNFEQKLGHLYEDALSLTIKNSKNLDLIKNNYQIFNGNKQTIGELDYIIYNKILEKYIHLELAVKFYLAIETHEGWQYPGPDQCDNWFKKSNHMINHQLNLSECIETKQSLGDNYNIHSITKEHLIYGCLFFPYKIKRFGFSKPYQPKCSNRTLALYSSMGRLFF